MFPLRTSVPIRTTAWLTYMLIGLNVGVFWFQRSLSPRSERLVGILYGLVPVRFFESDDPSTFLTLLSYAFLHGGWLHLILNMWTLWLFGPAIEDRLGHVRYLAFYLFCAIAAAGAQVWADPDSTIPVIGASGAIAGVLGAYVRLFPRSVVFVLVPIIFIPLFFELPAVLYIGIWFATQLFEGFRAEMMPQMGGVAWWAHVGGFVFGLLTIGVLRMPPPVYRPHERDEGVWGFDPRGHR